MLAPCRGDLEVLEVMVSSTKLRRGSHRSNAFQVVLSDVGRDALEACELTLKRLQFTGVPNYFGPQRFVSMRRPSFDGARSRRWRRRDGVDAIPRRRDAIDAPARESLRAAATLSTLRHKSLHTGQGLRDSFTRLQGPEEARGDVRE